MEYKNRGLDLRPIKEGKDWVLGGLSGIPWDDINPSGQWVKSVPTFEKQLINGEDTFDCTVRGLLSSLENLHIFKYGREINFSDPCLAIAADIVVGRGKAPQDTAETLRNFGVCLEDSLPGSAAKSVEDYYRPKPLTQELKKEAEDTFIWPFNFNYAFLFQGGNVAYKQDRLIKGLTKSPVGISVSAWFYDAEKGHYFKPQGVRDNHFVSLIGYEFGKYWIIFDSDAESSKIKHLDWNYDFEVAFIYNFTALTKEEAEKKKLSKLNIILRILLLLQQVFNVQKKVADKVIEKPMSEEEPKPEEKPDRVRLFARAIGEMENAKANYPDLMNSGMLRYTSYINSLGGRKGRNGFAKFDSWEQGFDALCQFVRDARDNKLRAYKDCTIKSFFKVYAPYEDNNNPDMYARFVAQRMVASIDEKLKDIL